MTLGFMQGRLSEPVDGRIQAFPRDEWREEFGRAAALGFHLMEWTLDADRLDENPLMTTQGRREIGELSTRHRLRVPSLTADFLMQASPLAVDDPIRVSRMAALGRVLDACAQLGIRCVVWPLVDQGRLTGLESERLLIGLVESLAPRLRQLGLCLAFESDYPPAELARLVDRFPADVTGVNYDTGNSASLGFSPSDEFKAYGHRVVNVHVKDRLPGGGTVELGRGGADFGQVFRCLRQSEYDGNLILQTARAADGDHGAALGRYRDFIQAVMHTTATA